MSLQIVIQYRSVPVTYNLTADEGDVYHFRLREPENGLDKSYIPEKLVIRRKGKIWVSDLEDYTELVSVLTQEIENFNSNNHSLA
jgi:hypothetical protein